MKALDEHFQHFLGRGERRHGGQEDVQELLEEALGMDQTLTQRLYCLIL